MICLLPPHKRPPGNRIVAVLWDKAKTGPPQISDPPCDAATKSKQYFLDEVVYFLVDAT
jgi:hypothetical protein